MFRVRYKRGDPDFIDAESYKSDGGLSFKFFNADGKEMAEVPASEVVSIIRVDDDDNVATGKIGGFA